MRTIALALMATAAIALMGCASNTERVTGNAWGIPKDLPDNPNPNKRYCKKYVEPTYRMVPKLCKVDAGGMKSECITVMKTTAEEVCVQPSTTRTVQGCDVRCEKTAVQVKPGGNRWEKDCNGCWQYVYRAPEYKWCDKTRQEEGIKFCYDTPAEYKTVVTSTPVQRTRKTYVPPKYEVKWVKEVYTPGHCEWVEGDGCGKTCDTRGAKNYTTKRVRSRNCPAPKALDCGCPKTN